MENYPLDVTHRLVADRRAAFESAASQHRLASAQRSASTPDPTSAAGADPQLRWWHRIVRPAHRPAADSTPTTACQPAA